MTSAKTTEVPSLNGAREKLRWARMHIDGLEAACKTYVENEGSFEVTRDHDSVPDWAIVSIRQRAVPPTDLALICGDAIHNMRTALDYLVRQLGIVDSGEVSDTSQFPIVSPRPNESEPELEQRWLSAAGRTLGLLTPTHVAEIRRLQPFVDRVDNSIGTMIGFLDVLENQDKHRLPLVTATAAVKGRLSVTAAGLRKVQIQPAKGPVVIGDEPKEIYRVRVFGNPLANSATIHTTTEFAVVFGSPGGPTVNMLRQLANLVGGVIGSFVLEVDAAAPRTAN